MMGCKLLNDRVRLRHDGLVATNAYIVGKGRQRRGKTHGERGAVTPARGAKQRARVLEVEA